MKYLLILFFAIVSCKNNELSENDKAVLQLKIDVHNTILQAEYRQDSLSGIDPDKIFPNRADNLTFDRNLTLEKLLAWCKEHNADPMQAIDVFTTIH